MCHFENIVTWTATLSKYDLLTCICDFW